MRCHRRSDCSSYYVTKQHNKVPNSSTWESICGNICWICGPILCHVLLDRWPCILLCHVLWPAKSWTPIELREYKVWWSQETLSVVHRLDNKDSRCCATSSLFTTVILILVCSVFTIKLCPTLLQIAPTKYISLLLFPYSLLNLSHECQPRTVSEPILARFRTTFLIKHRTVVRLMYAESFGGCFCLQGVRGSIDHNS
jgi:hypothetical protein